MVGGGAPEVWDVLILWGRDGRGMPCMAVQVRELVESRCSPTTYEWRVECFPYEELDEHAKIAGVYLAIYTDQQELLLPSPRRFVSALLDTIDPHKTGEGTPRFLSLVLRSLASLFRMQPQVLRSTAADNSPPFPAFTSAPPAPAPPTTFIPPSTPSVPSAVSHAMLRLLRSLTPSDEMLLEPSLQVIHAMAACSAATSLTLQVWPLLHILLHTRPTSTCTPVAMSLIALVLRGDKNSTLPTRLLGGGVPLSLLRYINSKEMPTKARLGAIEALSSMLLDEVSTTPSQATRNLPSQP